MHASVWKWFTVVLETVSGRKLSRHSKEYSEPKRSDRTRFLLIGKALCKPCRMLTPGDTVNEGRGLNGHNAVTEVCAVALRCYVNSSRAADRVAGRQYVYDAWAPPGS